MKCTFPPSNCNIMSSLPFRYPLTLLIMLALPALLVGQSIRLSPEAGRSYLDGLVEHPDAGNLDTLQALATTYAASGDTLHWVEARSWQSLILPQTDEAATLAGEVIATARQSTIPLEKFQLAPAYIAASRTVLLLDTGMVILEMAVAAAPENTPLLFSALMELAHAYGLFCDSRIEESFVAMESYLEGRPAAEQARLRHTKLDWVRAKYHAECTNDLEQAKLLFGRWAEYLAGLPPMPKNLANAYEAKSRVAAIASRMGLLTEAEELLAQLDSVDRATLALEPNRHATTYSNLWQTAYFLGELERAKAYLEEQLAYARSQAYTPPEVYSDIYYYLAVFNNELGRNEEALANMIEVMKYQRGSERLLTLEGMCVVLNKLGRHQAIIDTATSALQQQCLDCAPGVLPTADNQLEGGFEVDRLMGSLYSFLMTAHYELSIAGEQPDIDRMHTALSYSDNMLAFFRSDESNQTISELARFERSKVEAEATHQQALIQAHLSELQPSPKLQATLFNTIETGKGNEFRRRRLTRQLPAELEQRETELAKELRQLQTAMTLDAVLEGGQTEQRYLEVSEAYTELWAGIIEDYGDEVDEIRNTSEISLAELQAQLPAETAFLSYVIDRLSQQLIIQVVRRSGVAAQRVPLPEDFDERIISLLDQLASPLQIQHSRRQQFVENSQVLYKLLIAPVTDQLEGITTLSISPDGPIYYLPFEVLLWGESEEIAYAKLPFLLRDYRINYQYSATNYVLSRRGAPVGTSIAAFAPVFAATSTALNTPEITEQYSATGPLRAWREDGGIEPLPYSRAEVQQLSTVYGQEVLVKVDGAATRSALLNMFNSGHKVIHIATHGVINTEHPDLSALTCSGSLPGKAALVYASDIRNQKISADLVVLSSCESGIGREVSGEGLLALNRAFLYAGVRNVVSTLWKIDDRVTQTIMQTFHERIAAGAGYSTALHEAKLALLADPATAAPRYWAAFILIGE